VSRTFDFLTGCIAVGGFAALVISGVGGFGWQVFNAAACEGAAILTYVAYRRLGESR
jgi:hypothetical protein